MSFMFLVKLPTVIIAIRETADDFKKALKNKYDVDFLSFQKYCIEYQCIHTFLLYVLCLFACFCLFFFIFSICRIDMDAKEKNKTEPDETFWEVLMSADKKDFESICVQYGVTDFRGMLKKLNEKKIEREKEQEKVIFPHIFKGIQNKINTIRIKLRNVFIAM